MNRPLEWMRAPDLDTRVARGDDYAGDAWRNSRSGEIKRVAVGRRPGETGGRRPNRWLRPPVELTSNYRALDRVQPAPGKQTPILWPPRVVPWQDYPRRKGMA